MPKNGASLLYALYHAPDYRITGSVKFNKIIAKLYTEGLKIDVPLCLLKKGSAVQKQTGSVVMGIKDFAELWRDVGLLTITETQRGKERDRQDYKLTEEGVGFFRKFGEILIEQQGLLSHEKAKSLIADIEKLNSLQASANEHQEFFFDLPTTDRKEMFLDALQVLERKYKVFSGYPIESVEFDIAGMVGFLMGIIKKILDQFYVKPSPFAELGEQYLAHFYVLKHIENFVEFIKLDKINYKCLEEKYLLVRHITLKSKIIHSPTSDEFETQYFFNEEAQKSSAIIQ